MEKILQYADKLSVREHCSILYDLGLNMALAKPTFLRITWNRVLMVLAAADTASARHYLRNYAAFLANSHEYTKSNELLHCQISHDAYVTDNYPILQVIFAENFLNLHQLDSARYYWEQAWNNELKQEEKRAEGFSVRSALWKYKVEKQFSDYTWGTFDIGHFRWLVDLAS